MKDKNSQINKYLCSAPFQVPCINTNGTLTPCCINSKVMGSVKDKNLKDIWDGKEIKALRQAMLDENIRHLTSCSACHKAEDAGAKSLRQLYNSIFPLEKDYSIQRNKIMSLDLRLSNLCNLRCRYCKHESSSAWYSDQAQMHNKEATGEVVIRAFKDERDMIDQLAPFLGECQSITFAGGEPLLQDEHYHLLDHLVKINRCDIQLTYMTNFSKFNNGKFNAFDAWEKFSTIQVIASIDALGEHADYLRKGSDINQILKNRLQIKQRREDITFQVHLTVSKLNIFNLLSLIEELVITNFVSSSAIMLNCLREPSSYSIVNLSTQEKEKLKHSFNYAKKSSSQICDHLEGELESIINFMFSREYSKEDIITFSRETKQLDAIRGESYEQVFRDTPEAIRLIE